MYCIGQGITVIAFFFFSWPHPQHIEVPWVRDRIQATAAVSHPISHRPSSPTRRWRQGKTREFPQVMSDHRTSALANWRWGLGTNESHSWKLLHLPCLQESSLEMGRGRSWEAGATPPSEKGKTCKGCTSATPCSLPSKEWSERPSFHL